MSYIGEIIAKRESDKLLKRIHDAISNSLREIEEKKKSKLAEKSSEIDTSDFPTIFSFDDSALPTLRRHPVSRGGRPRGPISKDRTKDESIKTAQVKPEIICWQRKRLWHIGIEVPEELLNSQIKYMDNKANIKNDDYNEARLIFSDILDSFEVEWINNDLVTKHTLSFENKDSFLFSLGNDRNTGRLVKYPTYGSFVVFAPLSWERDVKLSGSPQISPQNSMINKFRVHFFNLDKNDISKIAFRNHTNELIIFEGKEVSFDLSGNRISDSCENMGPLFGEGPLSILSLNEDGWNNV